MDSNYKQKWTDQDWPEELTKKSELLLEKFYVYLEIINIRPAGAGTESSWTYIFDNEKDFLAFLKYSLIPKNLSYYGDVTIDDIENYKGEIEEYFEYYGDDDDKEKLLKKFIDQINHILSKHIDIQQETFSFLVRRFNMIFDEEVNPSLKIIAYGKLLKYLDKLKKEVSDEFEDLGIDIPDMRNEALENYDMAKIKLFLLRLNRAA
jgi:hypothetical protein